MRLTHDLDSVYLVPKLSNVESRDQVDLSVWINEKHQFRVPIIASPMKGIISPALIYKMADWGGIGIFHRFYDDEMALHIDIETAVMMLQQAKLPSNWFGISVGLDGLYTAMTLIEKYNPKIVCIDIANGYLMRLMKTCSELAGWIERRGYDTLIMSGNVVTEEGAAELVNSGVDLVRTGIGTGNLCTTRRVTGVGYGYIEAISECSEVANVVADGGIKNSGDAVKALAAGARFVMIGSLLAQTYESAHNGIIMGMASRKLQEEYYHSVKSIEGIEKPAEKRISFKDFASEFEYGIRSAFTYLGAYSIHDLQMNAEFVEIA